MENQEYRFEFTGKAGEYFKIWIVNILFTIVTLGVYSAWAKVRNKRYFYGNTRLDGSSFEYTAKPVSILKGRLIAVAVVAGYLVTASLFPLSEPVFWLAFVLVLPWLVVRAMTFNARNSVFRNIRFDFKGDYGEAFITYIGLPLLNVVTLGLAYPYFAYRKKQFAIANSGFGVSSFRFDATARSFYGVYVKALGMLVLTVIAFAIFNTTAMISAANGAEVPAQLSPQGVALMLLPLMILIPLYMLIGTYLYTATMNLALNGSRVKKQFLKSTLSTRGLFWIYFSNFVAIVLTLGLMIPWAKIRLARYRFENLSVDSCGELKEFIAGLQTETRATGEELADVLDVSLGL